MKEVSLLLMLLLLLPTLAMAQTGYEDVIREGISHDVGGDTLQLLSPSDVAMGRPFEIHAVLFYQDVFADNQGSVLLYRNGEFVSDLKVDTQDDPLEETYVFLTWTDVIEANTSYVLEIGNETIPPFFVEARELRVIDTPFTSQTTVDSTPLDEEELKELRAHLSAAGYVYSKQELDDLITTGQEKVFTTKQKIVKTVIYEDNTTRTTTMYTITARPNSNETLSFIQIIEDIPKGLVPRASDLDYVEDDYIVLVEDPLVMWHLEDVTQPTTRTYISDGEAQVNGNTIVLASTTLDLPVERTGTFKKLILPIILVFIVALTIIFFARFEPKR